MGFSQSGNIQQANLTLNTKKTTNKNDGIESSLTYVCVCIHFVKR